MRPRIVRDVGAGATGRPGRSPKSGAAILRPVEQRRAAKVAAELWVGVHLQAREGGVCADRVAIRAQRFTPRVSLVPPDGVLLEVKGSLHLFNGVEGLLAALAADCAAVGLKPALALAPTPLAAMVAARSGKSLIVTDPAQLIGQLSQLPLGPLRWPQDVVDRLARMGVRTIGQALRLPRAGFARRFGTGPLTELDRLTGRNPDLRQRFEARERFRRRRELTYELESTDRILGVMAPLLADLGRFLLVRQCGVTELHCLLRHRQSPASQCTVRLAAPLADVARLTELLGDRLNALVLPEPVRSCELRSGALVTRVLDSDSLWRPGEHGSSGGAESPELIERLRSRLGAEAVYGLQVVAAHRPESAWSVKEPVAAPGKVTTATLVGVTAAAARVSAEAASGVAAAAARVSARESLEVLLEASAPWPAFQRPLWLLREPRLLPQKNGLPRRRGALELLGDPERIETGWWDGGEIERDYYKALDVHGVRLWIFRERAAPHRWFLHGVFG